MSINNDGGPAFPIVVVRKSAASGAPAETEVFPGMSLRAWLAGQALVGIGSWTPQPENASLQSMMLLTHPDMVKLRADWAVKQADALLAALAATPNTPEITS